MIDQLCGQNQVRYLLLMLAMAMLLAAQSCTAPVGFATSEVAPEQTVLAYYQWINGASAEAIALEQNKLATGRGDVDYQPQNKIKRALLLSVSMTATAQTLTDAENLLQEALSEMEAASTAHNSTIASSLLVDYQQFAVHWLSVLQLRQQLLMQTQKQLVTQQSLSELQAYEADLLQRYKLLSESLITQQQKNEDLVKRNAAIQKQLDALTGIEKQLVEQQSQNSSGVVK